MLYFASLCCPNLRKQVHFFDDANKKPYIGTCGHTICAACIEENSQLSCPLCSRDDAFIDRTKNFASIKILEEKRSNFLTILEHWTSGEKFGQGACSKCGSQSSSLLICLSCDSKVFRLKYERNDLYEFNSLEDFLTLSRHVYCANCILDFHEEHERKRVDSSTFDAVTTKMVTTNFILALFRDEIERRKLEINCKLGLMKLDHFGSQLSRWIEDSEGVQEGECGYLGELINKEMMNKYTEIMNQEMNKIFNEKEVCNCSHLYQRLEESKTEKDFEMLYLLMPHVTLETIQSGCPINYKANLKFRKELYSILNEEPPEIVQKLGKECALCELLVVNTPNKSEAYFVDNCMEQYEKFWKNEMPPLQDICFLCLLVLRGTCSSCKKWKTSMIRNPPKKNILTCDKEKCLMKNQLNWNHTIKSATRYAARDFMEKGIVFSNGSEIEKKKILEKFKILTEIVNSIDLRDDNEESLLEKVKEVDEKLEEFKREWMEYRKECSQEDTVENLEIQTEPLRDLDESALTVNIDDFLEKLFEEHA